MRGWLLALALFAAGPAAAEELLPTTPWVAWHPQGGGLYCEGPGSAGFFAKGQHTAIWTAEVEALPLGIQFAFASNSATSWTVQQGVVAPSAEYGGGMPGVTPFDEGGTGLTAMQPVTFNSGGAFTDAYPGIGPLAGGRQGPLVIAARAGAAAAGQTVLEIPSNAASPALGTAGNRRVQAGMVVSDNLGAVTAGTVVAGVANDRVTLSQPLAGVVAAGQTLFFSWGKLALSLTVPASTNPPEAQFMWSDFVPFQGFRRTDGPMLAGMQAAGEGVPEGAKVVGVTQTTVTLSPPPSAPVPPGTRVTFATTTAATAGAEDAFVVPLANTALVRTGQHVEGPGIAEGTLVTEVLSAPVAAVRLSRPATVAAGAALSFGITATTDAPGAGGVLRFASTTGKYLITARFNAVGERAICNSPANRVWLADEAALGLPMWHAMQGSPGHDGVNFADAVGNTEGGVAFAGGTPVYGARILTAGAGWVLAVGGDSHMSGATTASGAANFARLACARISTERHPCSVWNAATGGAQPSTFLPQLWSAGQALHPSVLLLQGFTHNLSYQPDGLYAAQTLALMDTARRLWGSRSVIVQEMPRQSHEMGLLRVAGGEGRTLRLDDYPAALALDGKTEVAVAGVDSACIPPGITAVGQRGENRLELSQPVNCPAGTIISLGRLEVAEDTDNTTTVPLAHPATVNGNLHAIAPGLEPQDTIKVKAGDRTATLSVPRSLRAGTLIALRNNDPMLAQSEASQGMYDALASADVPVLRSLDLLADAEGTYLDAYATDSVHANDFGNAALAEQLVGILRQMGVRR